MDTILLVKMLKEREARRDQLQAQIEPLVAERDALDIAIRTLNEVLGKIEGKRNRSPQRNSENAGQGDRTLREHWIKTLHFIGAQKQVHLNDIDRYLNTSLQMNLSADTQRSQISSYAKKGWLERVGEGTYRLTQEGAAKAGYKPVEE